MAWVRLVVLVASALSLLVPTTARAVSVDPGFNAAPPNDAVEAVAVQDDGRIVIGGRFTSVAGAPQHYLARLEKDGSLDASFAPVLAERVTVVAIQPGRGLVAAFGVGATGYGIVRVTTDGVVDPSFHSCSLNGEVTAMVVQRDGKILVAGAFTSVGAAPRLGIARLEDDGTLDVDFDAHADELVLALALQADGRILAGGRFEAIGGSARGRLARLNPDGSADASFADPAADSEVDGLALQPDGRVVVSGQFSSIGGSDRSHLARLNGDGTLDGGFTTGMSGQAEHIAVQRDGRVLLAGSFGYVGGVARYTLARLLLDGSLDPGFDPGADCPVLSLALQGDGMILVGGCFGAIGGGPAPYVGRLHPDGLVDRPFAPQGNNAVYATALQPDGRIVVGGAFTSIAGEARSRIARLNPNGTADATFAPGVSGGLGLVTAVAVQADGRIVIGGNFDTVAGAPRSNLARLNADGTLDADFLPNPNGQVNTIALQPNGKILVGGEFTSIGGATRGRLARLNASGSVELVTFQDPDADDTVMAVTVQPDGKILVGGNFTHIGGQGRERLARLNPGGTLDTSFAASANAFVYALALQPDGKIFVGGAFTSMGGRNRLARLDADGTVDGSFFFSANGNVFSMALQPDGRLVVGGAFTTVVGQPRNFIARLVPDLDPPPAYPPLDDAFDAQADAAVYTVAPDASGRVVVGGGFYHLAGAESPWIGRLAGTDTAVVDLAVASDGSSVLWLREGAGPEVGWTTLEYSADGSTYSSLGSPVRVSTPWYAGWELASLDLPGDQPFSLRARGVYANSTSSSIVESLRRFGPCTPTAPVMVTHPFSVSVLSGASVSFTSTADGDPVPTVVWQVDSGSGWVDVDGASATTYEHTALTSESGYRYRAVFTNGAGSAVSDPATLTVTVPVELMRFTAE